MQGLQVQLMRWQAGSDRGGTRLHGRTISNLSKWKFSKIVGLVLDHLFRWNHRTSSAVNTQKQDVPKLEKPSCFPCRGGASWRAAGRAGPGGRTRRNRPPRAADRGHSPGLVGFSRALSGTNRRRHHHHHGKRRASLTYRLNKSSIPAKIRKKSSQRGCSQAPPTTPVLRILRLWSVRLQSTIGVGLWGGLLRPSQRVSLSRPTGQGQSKKSKQSGASGDCVDAATGRRR